MAPQLTATKGSSRRAPLKWMARATISLPLPLSPSIRQLMRVSLMRRTRS